MNQSSSMEQKDSTIQNLALVDYQKHLEGARKKMNDWVETKTKENIKQ